MTLFDYAVLGIVGFSVAASVLRGAVREVMALGSWIAAFWAAKLYGAALAPLLPQSLSSPAGRAVAGFLGVFLAALVAMSLLTLAVSRLVKTAGLGPVDRSLGAVFGLARGLLVVVTLVLFAGFTSLPREPMWQEAALHEPLEQAASNVRAWLPADIAKRIRYD